MKQSILNLLSKVDSVLLKDNVTLILKAVYLTVALISFTAIGYRLFDKTEPVKEVAQKADPAKLTFYNGKGESAILPAVGDTIFSELIPMGDTVQYSITVKFRSAQ